MPCGDYCGTYVLSVSVANTNVSIMGALAVQFAFYGFAAKIVNHPALCALPRLCAEFGRIYIVQSNRGALDNDSVSVSDV